MALQLIKDADALEREAAVLARGPLTTLRLQACASRQCNAGLGGRT